MSIWLAGYKKIDSYFFPQLPPQKLHSKLELHWSKATFLKNLKSLQELVHLQTLWLRSIFIHR